MNINQKDLALGMDIGTSSIKLVLLNILTNEIEYEEKISTYSAKISTENSNFDEQDVRIIVDLIKNGFDKIPEKIIQRIKGIQLCGQMHGLVLWNQKTKEHTNLITWQDQRCDEKFLKSLPIKSRSDLSSGFGCASLFWLSLRSILNSEDYKKYDSAGTIHDFITFLLSGKNLMTNQNALSWGYFDLSKNNWQDDLLKCDNFPFYLLPNVAPSGTLLSKSVRFFDQNSTQIDAYIYNALGDLQCSVLSCLENDYDCVINFSTSAQFCVSIDTLKYESLKNQLPKSVTCFPFFGNKILLVAASLNGGNVLEKFIDSILSWHSDLNFSAESCLNREEIWKRLIELSLNAETNLICEPTLYGERHAKNDYGVISNIRYDNLNVGSIFKSICNGLVKNLHSMITKELIFDKLKCKRILATGGALIRNPVLKSSLESEFNYIPIVYKNSIDAANGSTIFLKSLIKDI